LLLRHAGYCFTIRRCNAINYFIILSLSTASFCHAHNNIITVRPGDIHSRSIHYLFIVFKQALNSRAAAMGPSASRGRKDFRNRNPDDRCRRYIILLYTAHAVVLCIIIMFVYAIIYSVDAAKFSRRHIYKTRICRITIFSHSLSVYIGSIHSTTAVYVYTRHTHVL